MLSREKKVRNISSYYAIDTDSFRYISHHGVLGQKWGVRRYQNPDGTLTSAGKKHIAEGSAKAKPSFTAKKSISLPKHTVNVVLNGTTGGGGVAGAVMDQEVKSIEEEMDELLELGGEIEGDKTTPAGFASKEYMALLSKTKGEMASLSERYKASTDNAEKQAIVKEMRAKKDELVKARKEEESRNKTSVGVSGTSILNPKSAITSAAKSFLTAFAEEHSKKR